MYKYELHDEKAVQLFFAIHVIKQKLFLFYHLRNIYKWQCRMIGVYENDIYSRREL